MVQAPKLSPHSRSLTLSYGLPVSQELNQRCSRKMLTVRSCKEELP